MTTYNYNHRSQEDFTYNYPTVDPETMEINSKKIVNALANAKAIIWDLDGTIIDSLDVWPAVDKAFCDALNIEYPSVDWSLHEVHGMSFTDLCAYTVKTRGLSLTPEECCQMKLDAAVKLYRDKMSLTPAVGHFIHYAADRGIKMAIATSIHRDLLDAFLEANKIPIEYSVTSDEVGIGKPAPDVYLAAMKYLGVEGSECVVFEDSISGVKAGKAAGAFTVAVPYGRHNSDHTESLVNQADAFLYLGYDSLISE